MEYTIELFETLKSTNHYLENLEPTPYEGRVIRTTNQTGGVGQQGNVWESEAGKNLTFSLLLKPTFLPIASRFMLTKAISIAILDFLKQELPDQEVYIKWPNDIYVGKKKLCGVLISTKFRGTTFNSAVIGIGFNVNQTLFSRDIPNPTSLKIITGRDYDLDAVLNDLLIKIDMWYEVLKTGNFDRLDSVYIENFLYLGQERDYYYKEKPLRATIIGVENNGFLRIKSLDNEEINCDLKELRFIH